jgi:type IX secretion system PorP/SprF family membrane protein
MKEHGQKILMGFATVLLSWQLCLGQQKMQFTQYMFNGAVINPAYAGADGVLSLTAIQRQQWAGIENAPSTQTLSAHALVKKKQFGIGAMLVNDRIGVHTGQTFAAQYAYHLPVSEESFISFGLQSGLYSFKSDYASLGAQANDPQVYDPVTKRTFFDVGAGLYYRSPKLHLGISAPELIPRQVNFNDTLSVQLSKVNLLGFARYTISTSDLIDVQPSLLVKYLRGVPASFDLNVNMIYRKVLLLGGSFRKSESISFLMKMQITTQLQLGYAYDHPIGIVARASNGSHELMAGYVFKEIKKKVISPR